MRVRNTVSTRIAAELRREIDAGTIGADGRFPTERELAARFDVARNTIRRAMNDLEASGQIVREIGRGTFISSATSSSGAGTGAAGDAGADSVPGTVVFTGSDISPRDLIEARLMIEPAAAAAAALNATDADIARLMAIQEASRGTSVMEEFEKQDAEIHRLLFSMTQNQLVQRMDTMIRSMRNNADWLAAKRRAYSADLKARYVVQHAAIIDAVRQRSPKAAREAMIVHLEEVRRTLLDG